MNTLIKPTIQNNFKSSDYSKPPFSSEHCVEYEYKHLLNSSFQTADAGQDSALKRQSPRVRRRPLPPAKPPMRLR